MSKLLCKGSVALMVVVGTSGFLLVQDRIQAQTTPPTTSGSGALPSDASAGAATPQANPFTADWLIGKAVSNASAPQYQDVTDAITRFRNQDIAGARELLNKAREKDSKIPPVEIEMARLWAAANQLNGARAELEKAVTNYPDDPEAYLYFAELALAERRFTDADAELAKAKDLVAKYNTNLKRKRDLDMRLNSAQAAVAENRSQWSEAMPFLEAWLKLDANNAQAHQRLGRVLFQLGKPTEAYNEYDAAVKIDPKAINPYIALADLYEQAKDRPNAAKSITYAVQKNPKDLNVQLQAARWGLVTNQLNEAQKYAEAAMKIDADSLDAKILRGVIARMTGDLKTAETLLGQAVVQAPGNLEASNQLALVLIESSDKAKQDRAKQIAELNLRATTQNGQANPEIAATYAWVLYKLGDTAQAEQILNKILTAGAVSPDTAYYIGKILQDRGKTEAAISVLEQALGSTVPFAQRQATADLLAQLKKEQKDKPATDEKK